MRHFSILFAVLVLLCGSLASCESGGSSGLDKFSTYEYTESSVPGIGATNLILRNDGSLELYRIADTVRGTLAPDEVAVLAPLLKSGAAWDSTFRDAESTHEHRLSRFHPEGVKVIRYFRNANAPENVKKIMQTFSAVCDRLRREADAARDPA